MAIKPVRVELGERSYDILIGAGLLDELGSRMVEAGLKDRALIITNPTVNGLYGDRARASLEQAGIRSETVEFPDGEQHKQLETLPRAYDRLIDGSYTRATTIVALGGGVVGDMAGFVAATWMRGVRYVQVPTTLLAMVDSSIGGKTAVNHRLAKNMIGAFHQPRLVVMDLDTLGSLSRREFAVGYVELFKHGVIWDPKLLERLEADREAIFALETEPLGRAVRRSCEIKAEVVSQDEREVGLRAILNFGHTFGHALEAVTDYKTFFHGEAVGIGIIAAARTAAQLGIFAAVDAQRIEAHLAAAGLPTRFPALDIDELTARFSKDKKAVEGAIRFVLPDRIGHVVIRDDISPDLIREVIEGMTESA